MLIVMRWSGGGAASVDPGKAVEPLTGDYVIRDVDDDREFLFHVGGAGAYEYWWWAAPGSCRVSQHSHASTQSCLRTAAGGWTGLTTNRHLP